MTLFELKSNLKLVNQLLFKLPNGEFVPEHFHVTEVALVQKNFIDCGATLRNESVISLQLWNANDYNHRLHPEKLVHIIELSEKHLALPNLNVVVEYQGATIETYNLEFNGIEFELKSMFTNCLAQENCGVEPAKNETEQACIPGGGCC